MDNVFKNGILFLFATAGGTIAYLLGGWDASIKALIWFMAADFATGLMVAFIWHRSKKSEDGKLDSKASFKGLCKKISILFMVLIATQLDIAMNSNFVRTSVVIFFIGNEGISLLENFGLMGIPYPKFLKKSLEVLKDNGNKGDEES